MPGGGGRSMIKLGFDILEDDDVGGSYSCENYLKALVNEAYPIYVR